MTLRTFASNFRLRPILFFCPLRTCSGIEVATSRREGDSVGSPELYENRVLIPKPFRCFQRALNDVPELERRKVSEGVTMKQQKIIRTYKPSL
jgi:hypothetical protein